MRQLSDNQIKMYKVVMWIFAFTTFFNLICGEWLVAILDAIIAMYAYELYSVYTEIKNYFWAKDALDGTHIDID